jgi:hypothetical protein
MRTAHVYDFVTSPINKFLKWAEVPVRMLPGETILYPEKWPKKVWEALKSGPKDDNQLRKNLVAAASIFSALKGGKIPQKTSSPAMNQIVERNIPSRPGWMSSSDQARSLQARILLHEVEDELIRPFHRNNLMTQPTA